MRAKFLLASAVLVGLGILFLTQTGSAQIRIRGPGGNGGGQGGAPPGGGAPGAAIPGGGGGAMRIDPDQIFDRMAQGKSTISIAEMRMGRDRAEEWARSRGINNGQLTRKEFSEYMSQAMSGMSQGGGRRDAGGGSGDPRGADSRGGDSRGGDSRGGDSRGGDPRGGDSRGGDPRGGDSRGGRGDPASYADSIFRRSDRDENGVLSYEEMSEKLKVERDRWDENDDGQIDLTEYKVYYAAYLEQQRAERDEGRPPEAMDRSRDYGNVPPGASTEPDRRNTAELDKKVTVYRAGKLPSNAPRWFKDYDMDGDAQIALYEWKEKEGTVPDFRKLDLNEDGFITAEEAMKTTAVASRDGSASGYSAGDQRGGSSGGQSESDRIFDSYAGGGAMLAIAKVPDPKARERLSEYAARNNIRNGEMTREQFAAYVQERASGKKGGGGTANQFGGGAPGAGIPGGGMGRGFGGGAPGGGAPGGGTPGGGMGRGFGGGMPGAGFGGGGATPGGGTPGGGTPGGSVGRGFGGGGFVGGAGGSGMGGGQPGSRRPGGSGGGRR